MNEFIEMGVEDGDILLVHSDITGKVPSELYKELHEAVGERGAIIVPTFNYDFCKGKVFDYDYSPSQVGLFSNWVLFKPDAHRSTHPIFSFATRDIEGRRLLHFDWDRDAFGFDSIFARLLNVNAKMLFYHCSFNACTFVHLPEQEYGVDYRYKKDFTGTVITNEGIFMQETFPYNVRYLKAGIKHNFKLLESKLKYSTKHGKSLLVTCEDVYYATIALLQENKYGLLSPSFDSTRLYKIKNDE